jgi:redox-regulated HSP33 family molecular chaperone
MPIKERQAMLLDGAAHVHCQFCNKEEVFQADALGIHQG